MCTLHLTNNKLKQNKSNQLCCNHIKINKFEKTFNLILSKYLAVCQNLNTEKIEEEDAFIYIGLKTRHFRRDCF